MGPGISKMSNGRAIPLTAEAPGLCTCEGAIEG